MKAVKVHCGSAYVRGKARNYRYFIAQLLAMVPCTGNSFLSSHFCLMARWFLTAKLATPLSHTRSFCLSQHGLKLNYERLFQFAIIGMMFTKILFYYDENGEFRGDAR